MIGYIYKLVCKKTGLCYYGSTLDIDNRQSKGWYRTSCEDFINPTLYLMETLEIDDLKELKLKENDYILNNNCVNVNLAIKTEEQTKNNLEIWKNNNRDSINGHKKKYINKVIDTKKFYCDRCDYIFTSNYKLNRHYNTKKHLTKVFL